MTTTCHLEKIHPINDHMTPGTENTDIVTRLSMPGTFMNQNFVMRPDKKANTEKFVLDIASASPHMYVYLYIGCFDR